MLSGSVEMPEGFEVPAGETWTFDPEQSTTVEVGGNVVVAGALVMRPASRDVTHTLRFVGVDETRFSGGGMEPIAEDVGLWVIGDGVLDVAGTGKPAWAYEWQTEWAGDEVVAAPNEPGVYDQFPVVGGPDEVPDPNGLGMRTELLNLTRNVVIEGTPQGKAHIFIRSSRPQHLSYLLVRYMGPDLSEADRRARDQDQTGRYALHFHHNEDASRGSVVEGVVVRDADNHAFVPHASHGITFRDTISFNTRNAAYWWDPTSRRNPGNASSDIRYERAVAALVHPGDRRDGAFQLGEGEGSALVDSVAVGVQTAGNDNSGYHWPGTERGVWEFNGNIAHNNFAHGIFVWQNARDTHVIEDFTAYYNAKAAIKHGAYRNAYIYRDLTLLDNDLRRGDDTAIESHAVGRRAGDGNSDMQLWEDVRTDGAVLRTAGNAQDPEAPVRFVRCDFRQVVLADGRGHPSDYEFIDCGLGPDDVIVERMHPDSTFRVQDGDEAWELRPGGETTAIAPFATG